MANFKFNLLPKKSQEMILKEKKRDGYSVYYSFLVLFGVVLWLGLVGFNHFVVDRSTAQWKQINEDKQKALDTEFYETRRIHGELVTKTKSIAPLLQNDIDPEEVFRVAEDVFPITEGNVKIVGYGRNDDGSFTISISAPDNTIVAQKARKLRNLSIVSDLNIEEVMQTSLRNQIIAEFNFSVDPSAL